MMVWVTGWISIDMMGFLNKKASSWLYIIA